MLNLPALYLGVDGGGTKTKAVLIDQNRYVIGRGHAAGSNANIYGFNKAIEQIALAIFQAVDNQTGQITGCIAIAGVDTKLSQHAWDRAIANHFKLSKVFIKPPFVINDIIAALRSGTTDKNALAVIAGTGSSCWGRNQKGQEAKAGGVDYILSDEGSGYDIGLKILKSVTRHLDGRGPNTLLTELLFKKFGINSLQDIYKLIYQKPWNKTDIAKIAPLAEEAAKKKDQVSVKIIESAAIDLGILIKAVVHKLKLKNKPYTLVTSGSLFKIQKILCEQLRADILKFSPKVNFVKPSIDSATAAAYLAMEKKF